MEIINAIQHQPIVRKHGSTILLALAALLLLVMVVDVFSDVRKMANQREIEYKAPGKTRVAKQVQYKIENAINANLLGNPAKRAAPPPKKAPKTTLKLDLQGILYSSNPNEARAIIKNANKTELYSVGEKIKGTQVSIKDIRESEVLLNRNGATESLPLVKKTTSGDREIISFSDSGSSVNIASNTSPTVPLSATSANTPPRQPSQPRRIKQPNFSGLDAALKKMGDL